MNRRALLSALGAASLPLSGCLSGDPDEESPSTPATDGPPDDAPSPTDSFDCEPDEEMALDVDPPEDDGREALESFVARREQAEITAGLDPLREGETRSSPSSRAVDSERRDGGLVVVVETAWHSEYPESSQLTAEAVASAPDGVEPIPLEESSANDIVALRDLVASAAESDGEPARRSAQYPLAEDVAEALSELPGGEPGGFVDVDGAVVEVEVHAVVLHSDYGKRRTYFVDDDALWRVTDAPHSLDEPLPDDLRAGPVVACRPFGGE